MDHFNQEHNVKIFVWKSINKVSDNYHEDGGLVVFAKDEARAREIANATDGVALKPTEAPDDVREMAERLRVAEAEAERLRARTTELAAVANRSMS